MDEGDMMSGVFDRMPIDIYWDGHTGNTARARAEYSRIMVIAGL